MSRPRHGWARWCLYAPSKLLKLEEGPGLDWLKGRSVSGSEWSDPISCFFSHPPGSAARWRGGHLYQFSQTLASLEDYSEHPVTMVLRRSTGSVWDTTAHSVYGGVYGCVKDLQCLKPTASACHRRKQNTSEFFLSCICFMYDMQRKDIYVFICKSATAPLLPSSLVSPGVRPLSSPQASFPLGYDPSPLVQAQHT